MRQLFRKLFTAVAALAVAFATDGETPSLAPLPAVSSLKYHLRLAPMRNRDASAELLWNVRGDSARVLLFKIPAIVGADAVTGFECRWSLAERAGRRDSILASGVFRARYNSGEEGFSAILNAGSDGGTLCLGGDAVSVEIPVPFDCRVPGAIGYRSEPELKELRNTVWFSSLPPVERSRFCDSETLVTYIRASSDPYEGLWQFLDRESDPGKSLPGAAYKLATVSDGAGGYEIVNLADMTVKGRMRPTDFSGDFDLEWKDAEGRTLSAECHASYELQNLALRFHFPLLSASLRFRRM